MLYTQSADRRWITVETLQPRAQYLHLVANVAALLCAGQQIVLSITTSDLLSFVIRSDQKLAKLTLALTTFRAALNDRVMGVRTQRRRSFGMCQVYPEVRGITQ